MLSFVLGEKLRPDGIAVNSLQINGARLSRKTLRKFTLFWRVVGRLQSLTLAPPEFMADRYLQLAGRPDFGGPGTRHCNHRLEVMQPGAGSPGFFQTYRQVLGASVYPPHADDAAARARVLHLCEELTQPRTGPH